MIETTLLATFMFLVPLIIGSKINLFLYGILCFISILVINVMNDLNDAMWLRIGAVTALTWTGFGWLRWDAVEWGFDMHMASSN